MAMFHISTEELQSAVYAFIVKLFGSLLMSRVSLTMHYSCNSLLLKMWKASYSTCQHWDRL